MKYKDFITKTNETKVNKIFNIISIFLLCSSLTNFLRIQHKKYIKNE